MARAIRSFPNGFAGGPDGIRPQYLKDLTGSSAGNGGKSLLTALSLFSSLVIQGKVPTSIHPFFFRANLIALEKKDGGIRPIAVGCTLHCFVAKIADNKVTNDMSSLHVLAPRQLGFGIKGGAEVAVHAARQYLHSLPPDMLLLKLDFSNAFNSI